MPRLEQIPRAKAAPEATKFYDLVFGADRDPVANPGTATGTPGTWWTVHANAPAILTAYAAYDYSKSPLPAALRSLATLRTGYLKESKFVFSQQSKGARAAGVSEEKIQAIPHWQIATCFDARERAVLAYTDCLVLQSGRVSDVLFETLRAAIGDETLIVLGYAINSFAAHATTSRALRLEYDDVPERIVEVPAPKSA